jgi:hypothetical protein
MPKEIFDQARPKSSMARRLDEAFAGCDEWTLAPAGPRRDEIDVVPWLSSSARPNPEPSRTAPESRAA